MNQFAGLPFKQIKKQVKAITTQNEEAPKLVSSSCFELFFATSGKDQEKLFLLIFNQKLDLNVKIFFWFSFNSICKISTFFENSYHVIINIIVLLLLMKTSRIHQNKARFLEINTIII